MDKREEIREGIKTILYQRYGENWKHAKVARQIVHILDSKDVVIKVETWLPARSGMTCTIEPLVEK